LAVDANWKFDLSHWSPQGAHHQLSFTGDISALILALPDTLSDAGVAAPPRIFPSYKKLVP
jgi:hypothetical protein